MLSFPFIFQLLCIISKCGRASVILSYRQVLKKKMQHLTEYYHCHANQMIGKSEHNEYKLLHVEIGANLTDITLSGNVCEYISATATTPAVPGCTSGVRWVYQEWWHLLQADSQTQRRRHRLSGSASPGTERLMIWRKRKTKISVDFW